MIQEGIEVIYNLGVMPLDASKLSDRELEILRLVATGASNKAIAEQLSISSNTVKVHLRNIFEKIQVESRTEAAMLAVSSGLVPGLPQSITEVGMDNHLLPEADAQPLTPKTARRNLWLWAIVLSGIATVVLVIYILISNIDRNTEIPPVESSVSWKQLAALPTPRSGLAAVSYDEQIYAIGGENSAGVSGVLEVYDPQADSWQMRAQKPLAVADIQAGIIAGKIFVPGGRQATGEATSILEIYDPIKDQWSRGADLPTPVSGYSLVEFEGKLYLFGGINSTGVQSTVQVYNPDLDEWNQKSTLPGPVVHSGAAVVGGNIYLLGGFDGQNIMDQVLVYSPNLDNGLDNPWDIRKPMQDDRQKMGSTSTLDVIYIVGGEGNDEKAMPTEAYLTSSGAWLVIMDSPETAWSRMGIVTLGNNLYALGGSLGDVSIDQVKSIQVVFIAVLPLIR